MKNSRYTRYEIEKSVNGIDFLRLSTQNASSSAGANTYKFLDAGNTGGEVIYYRIRAWRQDGSFEYSPVVTVKKRTGDFAALNLFPSPAKDFITLEINDPAGGRLNIQVYNSSGILLKQASYVSSPGYNLVSNISLSGIPSGVYYLKISNASDIIYQRFIKQ